MSDIHPRDYDLDDTVSATEPERMKALADPLRMRLCDLVLERAMTVSELADHVGRPRGTVAYHIDLLVNAGLLKVVRTRKVRAIEERYYGRVARTFVFDHDGDDGPPFLAEVLAEFDRNRHHDDAVPGITTLRHARIPLHRAAAFTERLLDLAHEFIDEPRGGDVEFGMYLALYATNRTTEPSASNTVNEPATDTATDTAEAVR
ncbi:MAG: winged helix-turn-helix domain-containing protein [Ilumatobacteraceae bacterium]